MCVSNYVYVCIHYIQQKKTSTWVEIFTVCNANDNIINIQQHRY